MDEFDRVFNGENVAVLGLVVMIDHRRQGGGLARTRRPGHQHQTARLERQIGEDFRCVQIVEGEHLARNGAEHRARAARLVEGIDAKTRQLRHLEGKIDLEKLFVVLALRIAHDVVHHGVHRLVVERLDVDAPHVAMHANHRRQTRREVQIGGVVLDAECEQLCDVQAMSPPSKLVRDGASTTRLSNGLS